MSLTRLMLVAFLVTSTANAQEQTLPPVEQPAAVQRATFATNLSALRVRQGINQVAANPDINTLGFTRIVAAAPPPRAQTVVIERANRTSFGFSKLKFLKQKSFKRGSFKRRSSSRRSSRSRNLVP